MKTGTDMSLRTCRAEGYPVVEHFGNVLDPDKFYSLTISAPRHWTDNGRRRPGNGPGAYEVNMNTTYRELWRRFEEGGEGIKSYCDFKNCPLPAPDNGPSFGEFAALAGIVHHYRGV